MARKAKIESNKKRKKLAEKYGPLRKKLNIVMKDAKATDEEKFEAQLRLQKLPRNSSPVRYRNRCVVTGRSRGVYSAFGLSRIAFRELSLQGMIPGITKSSW